MLTAYFWAMLQGLVRGWAQAQPRTPGIWRFLRWVQLQQLPGVQEVGTDFDLVGPIYFVNAGHVKIGNHVTLRSSWHRPIALSVTNPNARLVLDDYVVLNWGVNIGVSKEVVFAPHSGASDDCVIYDTDWHSLDGIDQEAPTAPTRFGKGVWLCARVVVLKGVTIGENSVVGANSVVTHDLPANVVAAGAPAKVIRSLEHTVLYRSEAVIR